MKSSIQNNENQDIAIGKIFVDVSFLVCYAETYHDSQTCEYCATSNHHKWNSD